MGAGQSKTDQDEQAILNETPVQFSQDVVSHLADTATAPGPSPERQSSIDTEIRTRIHAELSRLQEEEEEVRREIELSLEKENLGHELKATGHTEVDNADDNVSEGGSHKTLNSAVLLGDLQEVQQKVNKFHSKREDDERHPAAQAARALSSCYANNMPRPLECWREVSVFKSSVAQLERDYIASFQ